MRLRSPELLILTVGTALVAGALLFPPWQATGVTSTSYRPSYDPRVTLEEELARRRAGIKPDTGWTRVDTAYWSIPFLSFFTPPQIVDPVWIDDYRAKNKAIEEDAALDNGERTARLATLNEDFKQRHATRLVRARIPGRFRDEPFSKETLSGDRPYDVARTNRFKFRVDYGRLFLTIAALAAITTALALGIIAWRANRNFTLS